MGWFLENDESREILAPRLAWRGCFWCIPAPHHSPGPFLSPAILHMAKSIKSNPPSPVFCDLLFSSMACRPPFRALCRCLLVAFAVLTAALPTSLLDDVASGADGGSARAFDCLLFLRGFGGSV